MSVLLSDRKESKIEVLTYSIEIHKMLIELMQRSFGVKDVDGFVRIRYAYGKDDKEDFSKYRMLMHNFKVSINSFADSLTANLRAANTIYPQSIPEYHQRRSYQNAAIVSCEQIKMELQKIVEVFEVDVNKFGPIIKAVNREIELIKRWRQSDNKIKSRLLKG